MAETFYVRIKPHNPKRGYKLKSYSVFGRRFKVEAGWYRIDDANAATYLKTVHNNNNDPESPLAFDVCTEAEFKKKLQEEHRERIRKGEIQSPLGSVVDMTEPVVDDQRALANKRIDANHIGQPTASDVGAVTTADIPRSDGESDPPADDLPPAPIEPDPPTEETKGDDLTAINGVGQSTAESLVAAGFETFAAVAAADVDQLKEVVGSKAKKFKAAAAELAG